MHCFSIFMVCKIVAYLVVKRFCVEFVNTCPFYAACWHLRQPDFLALLTAIMKRQLTSHCVLHLHRKSTV